MAGGSCTCSAAWFEFGCTPAAAGLYAIEETAGRSCCGCSQEGLGGHFKTGQECRRRVVCRIDCFTFGDEGGVCDRVRVSDWRQDAHSVEGFFRAGLDQPSSRVAGSGAMIHITAQMRVLVAIEPVDGRKGIDSLVRVCQSRSVFAGHVIRQLTGC